MINVAVCADKNIEVGLHVTLYSLLESSRSPVRINFLQSGYSEKDISKLRETLSAFDGHYELRPIDIDISQFNTYRGLHGNKFAFARILLANTLSDDRVIYLDSDLLVNKDLTELYHLDLGDHVIAVSGVGTIAGAIESEFFSSLGMEQQSKYFNSGVILINLKKWRNENITEQCMSFADQYPDKLYTADQTVMNYVFYENQFHELDPSYNHALYPDSQTLEAKTQEHILHFVGSPKPWDFLGEVVHGNYALFKETLNKTSLCGYKTYTDLSFTRLKRTLRLSRAYLHVLKSRL